MGPILRLILSRTERSSPVEEAVFAMVLNRLLYPLSKLGLNDRWLQSVYRPEFEQLQLHHFYRALDFLADFKDEIENMLFEQVRNLFNLEVDLVFWDTTSTYFEGKGPSGLAEYGYSKDHRPDRLQILVGVLMTREGLPIAHQIFPGGTADIDTFKKVIQDTRQRFCLNRVIFVGDRGMVSPRLLDDLDRDRIEYIAGVKMRKHIAVDAVLKTGGRYKAVKENLKVKEVWYDADRYIVCYNPKRAMHDQKTREELVFRLTKKLEENGPKSLIGERGYRRYLVVNKAEASLNKQAIQEEARYDGKYVLRTNCQLDSHQVAEAYKTLWRVERAFRELKSGLELRPVYHWNDSRVRGHVMVCFLALVLESSLIRFLQKDSKARYLDVMSDLAKLHAIEMTCREKTYLLRTELAGDAYEAFRVLGLRPPNKVQEIVKPQTPLP